MALLDGEILIIGSVTRTDLGSLGVKSNGEGSTGLSLLGFARVIDNRLVVLESSSVDIFSTLFQNGAN